MNVEITPLSLFNNLRPGEIYDLTEPPIKQKQGDPGIWEASGYADIIWAGLPNYDPSSPGMSTELATRDLNLSREVGAFLNLSNVQGAKFEIAKNGRHGLALISLVNDSKRVMFRLDKFNSSYTCSLDFKNGGNIWYQSESIFGDGVVRDLLTILKAVKKDLPSLTRSRSS